MLNTEVQLSNKLNDLIQLKKIFQQHKNLNITQQKKCVNELSFQIDSMIKQQYQQLCSGRKRATSLMKPKQKTAFHQQDREKICEYCDKYIFDKQQLLRCRHAYHEKCLISHMRDHLDTNQQNFKCLCGRKIIPQEYDFEQIEIQLIVKRVLDIQIQELKKKFKTQKCASKQCSFFWIVDKHVLAKGFMHKFCPFCVN